MRPEPSDDLISRFLEGALSEEEEKGLLHLIEGSPEAEAALGVELAVDRLLRESARPPIDAERILKALPRGGRDEFVRAVMARIPKRSGRRPAGHSLRAWAGALVAAGFVAGLISHAALRTSAPGERVAPPEARLPERREVEEERSRARVDRERTERSVAALRIAEEGAARERDRAERERQGALKRKAEEELLRVRTERQAEEARLLEARERERQAEREVARVETPAPSPRTVAVAATVEQVRGSIAVLAERGPKAAIPGVPILPGEGIRTSDGSAVVAFGDRTRLDLGPGAEVAGISDGSLGKRLRILKGRVTATVTRQPPDRPFLLATPHGEAKVLGTVLHVTVEEDWTRIEVVEGRVRLSRPDGKSVDVVGGRHAVAGKGQDLTSRPTLSRAQYEAALARRPDVLFLEDFEADAWKRRWSSPAEGSRVTEDRSVVLIGRRALEVSRDVTEWHRITLPAGSAVLHVRAYVYFPEGFDLGGGFSLFKLGALPPGPKSEDSKSLWSDHRPNGRDFFSAALLLTRRGTLQFYYYHPDQAGAKGDSRDGGAPFVLQPGRWHAVEFMCRANDPDRKNGVLRAWVDGSLVAEVEGLRFRDVKTLELREMALGGGGGSSSKACYVDDVVLARDYIGAALGDAGGVEPPFHRKQ